MGVTARPRITLEEYRALPDDGNRYEWIEGELYVTAAPTLDHQDVLAAIYKRLLPETEGKNRGRLYFAPSEVRLPTGDVVQPDLVYLRREHRHRRHREAIIGVPDLVVEVLSPSTREVDLGVKLRRFEAAGIPEYWIAEVRQPRLRIFVLHESRYVEVQAENGRLRSSVIPDLVVDVEALYDDAMWPDDED
jgi:Uma2 family endonuclease